MCVLLVFPKALTALCAKTGLLHYPVCQIKPDSTALFHFPYLSDHICYSYLSPL